MDKCTWGDGEEGEKGSGGRAHVSVCPCRELEYVCALVVSVSVVCCTHCCVSVSLDVVGTAAGCLLGHVPSGRPDASFPYAPYVRHSALATFVEGVRLCAGLRCRCVRGAY